MANQILDNLLSRLNNVRASNGGFTAQCPGHKHKNNDQHNSLSIKFVDNKILLKCFTGCDLNDILLPLDMAVSDLFVDSANPGPKEKQKTIIKQREWHIHDKDSNLIATHYRIDFSDKSKQMWWVKDGIKGLKGFKTADLPLYGSQLSQKDKSPYSDWILVEGEVATDALIKAGYTAFGTVCGAGVTPSLDVLSIFRDCPGDIYLWPDNDEPGYTHMRKIATILLDMGLNPLQIVWPEAPVKGDSADFLLSGGIISALTQKATYYPPEEIYGDIPCQSNDPYRFSLTDTGNAERFIRDHEGNIKFCSERGKWLIWSGNKWDWDDKDRTSIMMLSKTTVRNIYKEAGDTTDDNERKSLVAHAKHSESEQRRKAMVNLSQSEPNIPIRLTSIDSNPWYLNCKNGTVDLKTGNLIPHSKEHLITKIINTNYNPDAYSELWVNFLGQVTAGDAELCEYLQLAIGYSLTGDVREHSLFFLYGTGQNGKSTFINTIMDLLYPYSHQASMDIFLQKDRDVGGNKEGLANLQGKRFVCATELEEGKRLATALIKQATGGEMITADRKYEHEVSFWPTHKIWLSGNHKPRITDTTDSIWRRVKLIPFTVKIDRVDESLPLKLKVESEGILSWCIEGCLKWLNSGLVNTDCVTRATTLYREDEDQIGNYISDRLLIDSSKYVYTTTLYNDYKEWCKDNGYGPLGKKRFHARLEEKGFEKSRGNSNRPIWLGVCILLQNNESYE